MDFTSCTTASGGVGGLHELCSGERRGRRLLAELGFFLFLFKTGKKWLNLFGFVGCATKRTFVLQIFHVLG